MKRPFATWAAVAIALGVAVGCKDDKKPKNDTNPPQNPNPGNPNPGNPNAGNPNMGNPNDQAKGNAPPARGTIYTAEHPNGVPTGTTTNTGTPNTGTGTTAVTPPTGATGDVTVKQVNFADVESAIAAAKGKVVLIDCWATWCPPCVASFPKLVEKHNKYGSKGLAVMSLSLDDPRTAAKVLPFLQEHKATFTNLHLNRDAASQKGLVDKFAYEGGIPHAALFDKTGNRVWSGHPMDRELESKITAELAK